jgi:hypothetical protein
MGLPLVTKAEYKSYAGITNTTQDAQIDLLIAKTSELVKSVCRRTFVDYVDDQKVEVHEGGTAEILLKEAPVIAVNSVELSLDYGKTYTLLTEFENYVFSKASNSIKPLKINQYALDVYGTAPYGIANFSYTPYGTNLKPRFPEAVNGYKITYTAGYETLPEDLKLAVFDLIIYYQRNDGAVHSNTAPNSRTGIQVQYITDTSLPAHIRRILDLYTMSYD